jgi:hypothetical protein
MPFQAKIADSTRNRKMGLKIDHRPRAHNQMTGKPGRFVRISRHWHVHYTRAVVETTLKDAASWSGAKIGKGFKAAVVVGGALT